MILGKKRFVFVIVTAIGIPSFLVAGCTKKNNDGSNGKPLVSSNSPVTAGDSLLLSVEGVGNVFTYNWYGPDGFSSHDRTPAIANSNSGNAGSYTVDVVTKDGRIYTAVTDSVIINAPHIPCSPGYNTASISASSGFYMSYISSYPSGGSWFVKGSGGGDAELEFFGNSKPKAGIYIVQPQGGEWRQGNVCASLVNRLGLWYAYPGTVYVSVTNNKITVVSCDLQLYNSTYNLRSSGSLLIAEP